MPLQVVAQLPILPSYSALNLARYCWKSPSSAKAASPMSSLIGQWRRVSNRLFSYLLPSKFIMHLTDLLLLFNWAFTYRPACFSLSIGKWNDAVGSPSWQRSSPCSILIHGIIVASQFNDKKLYFYWLLDFIYRLKGELLLRVVYLTLQMYQTL